MSDDSSTEGSSSKVPLKRFGSPVNGGRLDGTPNKKRPKKQSESELAGLSGDDNAEQQATSQPPRISPGEMLTIVQNINQNLQKNKSLRKRRFSSFTDYDSFDLPANISSEQVRTDIKRYMREAVLLSSLSMNTAIDILSAFLSTGSSIQMDPEFPKKPRNAFTIFLKNTCMDSKGMDIKMAMTNCSSQWKSELFSSERERSEKQYLEQQKEYLRQLNAYKEKHPNLNKEHLEFINKLMLNTRKWVCKAEGTELKSPKKPKAPPAKVSKGVATKPTKTPFELFCMSKSDKYAELDEEKRERKLRKKFDKLTAAEREIYENLAAAL